MTATASGINYTQSQYALASVVENTPAGTSLNLQNPANTFTKWVSGVIQFPGVASLVRARTATDSDIVIGNIPKARPYKVSFSVANGPTALAVLIYTAAVFVNGAASTIQTAALGAIATGMAFAGEGILELSPGDIVDLRIRAGGAGDPNFDIRHASLSVELMQPLNSEINNSAA